MTDSGSEPTRQRILEAARILFTEKGYDKASLREVAERVGITKAALYYHFNSKEDLLFELIEQLHQIGHHGLDFIPNDLESSTPRALARTALASLDLVLEQRPMFALMERNRAAIGALRGRPNQDASHQEIHFEMERRWKAFVNNQQIPWRQRLRVMGAVGATMVSLLAGGAPDVPSEDPAVLREELARMIFDILEVPDADRPPMDG